MNWNYMSKVICPVAKDSPWVWANGCKSRDRDSEPRCCKCGQKGHEKYRER